jgi:hypothetical protein
MGALLQEHQTFTEHVGNILKPSTYSNLDGVTFTLNNIYLSIYSLIYLLTQDLPT